MTRHESQNITFNWHNLVEGKILWFNQSSHLREWIDQKFCCLLFSASIISKAKVSFNLFVMASHELDHNTISTQTPPGRFLPYFLPPIPLSTDFAALGYQQKHVFQTPHSFDLSNSEQQEKELLDDKELMSKHSLNRKMRRRFSKISEGDEDSKRRRFKNRGIKFW